MAEATGDNVFIVKNGELITPPAESGILLGITRAVVMGLAQAAGISVVEKNLTRQDLYVADECFLTGARGRGCAGDQDLTTGVIGSGKPGAVTQRLIADFHRKVRGE